MGRELGSHSQFDLEPPYLANLERKISLCCSHIIYMLRCSLDFASNLGSNLGVVQNLSSKFKTAVS